MRCMTDYARAARGLRRLGQPRSLSRAARRKAADILACDEFSHEAGGREFTYWMERFRYLRRHGCWRAGENIAWGSGRLSTVRSIFRAWISSPGHRRNILGAGFRDLGLGVRVGELDGERGVRVWTQMFGSRRC